MFDPNAATSDFPAERNHRKAVNWSTMKPPFIILGLVLLLASCSIPRGNGYRDLGQRYDVIATCSGGSESRIYFHKNSKRKLNGRFHLGTKDWLYTTGTFCEGKPVDTLTRYSDGRLFEKSAYYQGLKHGLSYTYGSLDSTTGEYEYLDCIMHENGVPNGIAAFYTNGILSHRTLFKDGRKESEIYFDEKGDTLTELHYSYDPFAAKPQLDESIPKDLSGYSFKGKITISGSLPYPTDFFFLNEIISTEILCSTTDYYLIETESGNWLCFYAALGWVYHKEIY